MQLWDDTALISREPSAYRSGLLFVCQIEKPSIPDRLGEEDSPSFPEEDIQHKLQMAVAGRGKKRKPTPVPLLFSFNSVNRPQVKISCSCRFNSASNDATTRSLFSIPPLFRVPFIHPSLPTPTTPPPFHPNKLAPPFLFPWAGLSCHVVLIGSTGNH